MLMKTKNYKFLAILLGLFLWSSVSYSQDTITVTVQDYVACPGDTVTVGINATNFVDVGSISLTLNYDTSVLVCNNILMKSAINTPYTWFMPNSTNGQVKIAWLYLNTSGTIGNLGDIDIFEIQFSYVNGASALGWDIAVPGNCQFADDNNNDIPTIYYDGSVSAPPFSVDVQPMSTTILDNFNTSFTVTATGANTYQWQVDDGAGFVDVIDGGVYLGATTAQLDLTAVPMTMNGYTYKCNLSGPCSMTMSTDIVILNVVSAMTIITNIGNLTECVGVVVVPVYATNFYNVGTIDLKLDYDNTILTWTGVTNVDPALGGLTITNMMAYLEIDWTSGTPANIGSGLLFEIEFNAVPGYSPLTWDTLTAGVCQYLDGSGTLLDAAFESGGLTIDPLPGQPDTPTGPADLCIDPANSDYTTTGATDATSYEWMLDPVTAAGTITGTGLTATVDWDAAWTGLATVKVRGMNSCGYGVYSADHNVIIVSGVPVAPNLPSGQIDLCINGVNTDYTTQAVAEASSYEWMITPANAGLITGTGLTGTVDWGSSYFGTADIAVRAVNNCGNGLFSASLTVTITPVPSTPGSPIGPDSICTNTVSTDLVVGSVQYATSYLWEITPAAAGSISGTDTNATVSWLPGFTGLATISVKSVNNCGQSMFAGIKIINVKPLPIMASTPTGISGMCINSPNSNYTTTPVPSADFYLWTLYPSNAGTITGTTTTATVDWDNLFTGDAWVKVKAINTCGDGAFSDSLHITISVPPVFNIGNDTTLCIGSSMTFTGPGGMASYIWSTGVTGPSITVLYAGLSPVTYSLTVTDAQGCAGSDSVNVIWNQLPIVDLGNDTTVCINHTITLDAGTGTNFIWSTGETTQTIVVDSTGVGIGIGTYSVTVSDNIGCEGSDDISVTWNQLPIVDLGNDTTVCINHTITLDAGTGTNFIWSTGETTQTIVVDSTGVGIGIGTYSVTVSDNIGCEGSDDISVTWSACPGIAENNKNMDVSIAPNPSNGQFNLIVGEVSGQIEMMVLNELGQLVYSDKIKENNSGNYTKQFNLTYLPKGIYFVKLVNENMVKVERIVIR